MRNDREDDDADVTTVDVTHGHSCGNAEEEEECRPKTFAMNQVGMNVVVDGMMMMVVAVVAAVFDATIDVMVMMMMT